MSQKKKMLSIKEKMEVLNVVDKENLSVRALAKRFNIGKTQNNIDIVIDEINTEELSDGESEDSNHVCVQDECQIKSYPEALEQLRRIKQFLRDDITGFQYAKTLERHLENLFLKHKHENLRQTTVYEFLKPKI